jgi:hypothetical protein
VTPPAISAKASAIQEGTLMTKSPEAAVELSNAINDGLSHFSDEADEMMGATDCPDGCTVEPDGHCPHGYESAALTLGVI